MRWNSQQIIKQMDRKDTLYIIQTLANGIDPITGEIFQYGSPFQNIEVSRALFHAAKIIQETDYKPLNAGKPWTVYEQNKVINEYRRGHSISKIAKGHKRTPGAIKSRLRKVGLVD